MKRVVESFRQKSGYHKVCLKTAAQPMARERNYFLTINQPILSPSFSLSLSPTHTHTHTFSLYHSHPLHFTPVSLSLSLSHTISLYHSHPLHFTPVSLSLHHTLSLIPSQLTNSFLTICLTIKHQSRVPAHVSFYLK